MSLVDDRHDVIGPRVAQPQVHGVRGELWFVVYAGAAEPVATRWLQWRDAAGVVARLVLEGTTLTVFDARRPVFSQLPRAGEFPAAKARNERVPDVGYARLVHEVQVLADVCHGATLTTREDVVYQPGFRPFVECIRVPTTPAARSVPVPAPTPAPARTCGAEG